MRWNRWKMLLGLLTIHVLIPAYCVLWVAWTPNLSQWDWIGKAGMSGLYLILLHFAGHWASVTYYLRYIWPVLFAGAVGFSFSRVKVLPFFVEKGTDTWVMGGLVTALFIYWLWTIQQSCRYREEPIRLIFPLRNGTFAILEGGNGEKGGLMNYHYTSWLHQNAKTHQSMRYAVDIARLNRWARAMRWLLPLRLEEYEMFHETVYSPCEGKVVEVIDQWPNEAPLSGDHPYNVGNRIVIRHGGIYVLMGHLQQGSILVAPGDTVTPGQPLAKVGNSGWTRWPHLHIQAVKADAGLWSGEGVPMLFDGVFPVRNELFRR